MQSASIASDGAGGTPHRSAGSPLIFFAITFAVSWGCWIPMAMSWAPYRSQIGSTLALGGAMVPALVALTLTGQAEGSAGVPSSTPFQSGEEIGWRGYVLPRLAARWGFGPASMVLGVTWALWHLPVFFIGGADKYGQSLAVYVLQVTALSVAMAFLYARTGGSLLLPMIMHAAFNNTKDIVPSATPGADSVFTLHASLVAWLTVALLWICAAAMLAWMPRFRPEYAS
jgi:membrane protease YdiL (CAAX protease family)